MISAVLKVVLAGAVLVAACGSAAAFGRIEEGFDVLAARCAPSVHPSTLAAVVRQESRFNPLAIGVNGGGGGGPTKARSLEEAIAIAERLLAKGRNIDLGLGQINSANLAWLGLSVRDAFDPCRNLAASARVLTDNYMRFRPVAGSDQAGLDAALSAYNTGSRTGGLRNGYVAKVRRGAGVGPSTAEILKPATETAPEWDVFARSKGGVAAQAADLMVFGGIK